ncbi:MAG: cation:proton antiporter [Sandaracinaceae bacterium]|nr:cation:proton antiporter [Sandaracinaceae bacterium]
MSGGHSQPQTGGVRKTVIVLLLVVGVVILHRFGTRSIGFDPSAMLALGFVVLASYAFGQLVERVGLPHITGYLIAGLLLGPSVASFIPEAYRVAPFVEGLLSEPVQTQLSPLKTLAVALIALTAGGELKIASLRRGFGAILGVLGGQVLILLMLCVGFVVAISGVVPQIALPGLGDIDTSAAIALGAVVGTISIATSPAATIAVINGLKARGPTTSSVLATVVLKDVVVVILFSVCATFASQAVGGRSSEGSVALYLLQHVGGGLLLGAIVGAVMALYLRYVKAEVLLFVVGVVYTAAFVAGQLHVEVVVLFITAGFVTANFSTEGDSMLETVEKLSLPVYVVFFTLAGAHLDLLDLYRVAPFAFALVALRGSGLWVGTRFGGRIGGATEAMQQHGWLGFVSQAGVAISLGGLLASPEMGLGETGQKLSTLIVAGIAINELAGPVLLKLGLTRAKETEETREAAEETDAPAAAAADADQLVPWPLPATAGETWGPDLRLESTELVVLVRELQLDLGHASKDVAEEPLARFHEAGLAYIRELRREFLRHHRRITVQATDDTTELNAAEALRLEQASLAEKWRAAVLARGARVRQTSGWDPDPIVAAVDALTEGLPEKVEAPYEAASYESKADDSLLRSLARTWLRARRAGRRLVGGEMAPRTVELRALARYHLWGELPTRLEPVAALYAQAETHLVARTRSIFEGLVIAYDELAADVDARGATVIDAASLDHVRRQVDEELVLAVQEVDRIRDDLAHRTSAAIGACLRDLKADLPVVATPDLPMRRRAASKLYKQRDDALRWLSRGTAGAREGSAAVYNRLALEMELHALEGRVKDALEDHATGLAADVRGRAHRQVERVREAIVESENRLASGLEAERAADALTATVRTVCEPIVRVSAEAARLSSLLRDQLADEHAVAPILDALTRAAGELTDRYEIPARPLPRGEHKLPSPVGTIEVPFRDWVLARIDASVAPRLLAATRNVAQKVEPLSTALSELERRVAFNVELAVNELSVHDGDVPAETHALVKDMIGGSLERNRLLFAGYSDASAAWGEEAKAAVREAVLASLDELRGALVDGEIGRIRSRMVRDVRGQRLVRFGRELRQATWRAWRITLRALGESIGEARIDAARRVIGLPVRLAPEEIQEHTFAAPAARDGIPMVYRRLFSAQALEAGDILTGRDDALDRAMSLLEGTLGPTLRTVAVVGPDGVGKSAFVNAAIRAKRWPKIRELKLRAPATLEEVDALFDPGAEGHLVVISGVHWLLSMRPGGLDPLRHFVARVVEDAGKNAFLVRADDLVWEQCKACAPLAEAFPEVVTLDPLDEAELEAAVLARHTVSGYGLVFSHGTAPRSRLEELALQATGPISRPRQSFFRSLHTASGGLLRDALRLWLASVQEVDEASDFVHLGPVPPPAIYALRRLDDEDVLTLYQVARQGWMSPEVYGSLFRTDAATARARLLALEHVDVLARVGGVWRVAEHLRGPVHRLLVEKGYIR